MVERLPEYPLPPTSEELIASVTEKFQTAVLPVLEENERWRRDSRHLDWPDPKPKVSPGESD